MKASSSLFSCSGVKAQASGHEAGGACWPAGVEKLPWKLWEVSAESWKCSYVSDMYYAKKSNFAGTFPTYIMPKNQILSFD